MSASVSDTYESAHDPLCPFHMLSQKPTGIAMSSCQCGLITRVREDERESNAAIRVHWLQGYARALRDAIGVIDAVDAKYEVNPDWVLWEARKAIEAFGVEMGVEQ